LRHLASDKVVKSGRLNREPGPRKPCGMRSATPPETGRVILFRPRQAGFRAPGRRPLPHQTGGLRLPLLAGEDPDDHRARRRIHALGLAFCLMLAVVGVWLANEMTEMKRIQDCVLSGRSGCIPLKVAAQRERSSP
jgi:hypothetical protein